MMQRSKAIYYEDVFKSFCKNRIRYLVVGGMAVNLHGIPRLTADLDVMIDLSEKNIVKTLGQVKALGYRPQIPVKAADLANPDIRKKWRQEKGALVIVFYHPKTYRQIDFFIENPIGFEAAYRRKKLIKLSGFNIPLIALEDLITLKKKAGRKQDVSDIEMLKIIRRRKKHEAKK